MQGDYEEKLLAINNDNSNTVLLFEAVKSGNLEIVRNLTNSGAKVNSRNSERNTPLHIAVRGGKNRVCRVINKIRS